MGSDQVRHRLATLRLSLLTAAGLLPIACGGAYRGDGGEGGGGSHLKEPGGARAGVDPDPGPVPTTGGSGQVVGVGGKSNPGPGPSSTCSAPKLDPATGLVFCQEGYEHRPAAVTCPVPGEAIGGHPGTGGVGGEGSDERPRTNGTVSCAGDPSICDAFDLGYCQDDNEFGAEGVASVCVSGCRTDLECGRGAICICSPGSPTGGTCVRAQCVTNDDCGPGYRCASYDESCGPGGFACQTAADECAGSAQCADELPCTWGDFGEYRSCDGAVCGRPFLVGSTARVAAVQETDSWSSRGAWRPAVAELSTTEREALAAHFAKMGQMEHASIAAFARFHLHLLALGAPASLVEESTRALADETAHARLCFELASAYAGRALGPGPLDVAESLHGTSLAEVVSLVIFEGCFGETSATLEALEAAALASDPVIAAAYSRIAEDEQRHAELAFRFVRWAIEREPVLVRERLRAALVCPPTQHAAARDIVGQTLHGLLKAVPPGLVERAA